MTDSWTAQAAQVESAWRHALTGDEAGAARVDAPAYGSAQLMALLGLDKGQLDYRIRKGELPGGRLNDAGSRRVFTPAEVHQWARAIRQAQLRPATAEGASVAVASFEGGTPRARLALTLAQGLSLRGHRVLLIDLDTQARLTRLLGWRPAIDVDAAQTVAPLFGGAGGELPRGVQPPGWDGLEVVRAGPALAAAEWQAAAAATPATTLDYALDPARLAYDVIVLDAPAAASPLAAQALAACDGLLMPLSPDWDGLAASAAFWRQGAERAAAGALRSPRFVELVLTEAAAAAPALRRAWSAAYGDALSPPDWPVLLPASGCATVFEAVPGSVPPRALHRAQEAAEQLLRRLEQRLQAVWQRQLQG